MQSFFLSLRYRRRERWFTAAADGPLLALREDIDALPITENTALPFASGNAGVSHACGHDIHTTALLGCAQYLCCHREALHGSVMLIFQCAEECCDGAETMLNAGLFDVYRPGAHHRLSLCAVSAARKGRGVPRCEQRQL